MLKAGLPWEQIEKLSLWELSAWDFAASKIDGLEKAGLTSAIAIAIGSIDKNTSKKLQEQWGLADLLTDDTDRSKESQVSNYQKKNPKGEWKDLVSFFTGLGGKV